MEGDTIIELCDRAVEESIYSVQEAVRTISEAIKMLVVMVEQDARDTE